MTLEHMVGIFALLMVFGVVGPVYGDFQRSLSGRPDRFGMKYLFWGMIILVFSAGWMTGLARGVDHYWDRHHSQAAHVLSSTRVDPVPAPWRVVP